MKLSEMELPSNRKFGLFFTFIFAVAAAYLYKYANITWAYTFILASCIFLVITLVKSEILLPLNKLWIQFGLLLGIVVNPILLGIIFFGLFTPIAFIMRLNRRDELRLKFSNEVSHWISRNEPIKCESFKNQF